MSEMTNITTEASDSPVSNKTVLRLDDVRKSFGNTQVLRGISFDIHQHRWWLCWGLPVQANPH